MHPIIDLCKRFVKDENEKNKDIGFFSIKKDYRVTIVL